MTVRDYFSARRDSDGRAWVNAETWIDECNGVLRLNGPFGVTLVAPEDAVEGMNPPFVVRRPGADERSVLRGEFEDNREAEEAPNCPGADQFDEYSAPGGWPGLSADDAEPGDFEDTLSDIEEGRHD